MVMTIAVIGIEEAAGQKGKMPVNLTMKILLLLGLVLYCLLLAHAYSSG
jgi:hypothetical protein